MSQINVDKVAARTGGAPTFPSGLNLVGVTTGLSVSGIATFADSTTSTSTSTGALIVTGGVGIGKSVYIGEDLIVAGNVTGLGTVTWEDVTNQDVLGLSTFRAGLEVGPVAGIAATYYKDGSIRSTGIVTATRFEATDGSVIVNRGTSNEGFYMTYGGSTSLSISWSSSASANHFSGDGTYPLIIDEFGYIDLEAKTGAVNLYHSANNKLSITPGGVSITGGLTANGICTFTGGAYFNGGAVLKEKVNIVANKLSAAPIINLDDGMTHYFTTTETTTALPNIRSSVGLNTALSTGDTISVTIITTAAAAGYAVTWAIDDVSTGITTSWVGGSAPTAGGSSGLDTYALTIIKTGASAYTIINNVVNSA